MAIRPPSRSGRRYRVTGSRRSAAGSRILRESRSKWSNWPLGGRHRTDSATVDSPSDQPCRWRTIPSQWVFIISSAASTAEYWRSEGTGHRSYSDCSPQEYGPVFTESVASRGPRNAAKPGGALVYRRYMPDEDDGVCAIRNKWLPRPRRLSVHNRVPSCDSWLGPLIQVE